MCNIIGSYLSKIIVARSACVVAYAFSPIDLIPDFIPILGYLDEVIFLPLGIMLALKIIPKDVLSDCEVMAEEMMKNGGRRGLPPVLSSIPSKTLVNKLKDRYTKY